MRHLSLVLLAAFVLAFVAGCASEKPAEAKCEKCGCKLAPDGTCPACAAKKAAEEAGGALEKATEAAKEAVEKVAEEPTKAVEEKK